MFTSLALLSHNWTDCNLEWRMFCHWLCTVGAGKVVKICVYLDLLILSQRLCRSFKIRLDIKNRVNEF